MAHSAWSPATVAKQRLKGLFLVLILIAAIVAAALVGLAVWGQNRLAGDLERKDARAALAEASEDFGRMLRLAEAWFLLGVDAVASATPDAVASATPDAFASATPDAVASATPRTGDKRAWSGARLAEALGAHFDMIIVVDAADQARAETFNANDGAARPIKAIFGPGVAALIAQARRVSAGQAARGVAVINGVPCLAAAAPVDAPAGTVLISASALSSDFIAAIGERFGLAEFRWRPLAPVDQQWETLPLVTLDGVEVGEMSWRFANSGGGLLLPLLLVALAATAAVGLVAWRIHLAWGRHDRQAGVIVQHLATVLEQTGDAILTCDSDGTVIGMNRAAELLLECSAAAAVGRSIDEVIVAEPPSAETPPGGAAAAEGVLAETTPHRLMARQAGGALIPIELRASRVEGPDQTIVIVLLRDDRERQRIEDALNQAQEAAGLAERTKSEFVSNISHELRTPLNAIIGFADMIRGEVMGPISERQYVDFAGDIFESGNHLLAVINDVIDLAGVDYGLAPLVERPLLPVDVVGACVRLARERAARSGISLIDDVDPGTPRILADEAKVKQMLIHLLSNAIKFSSAGGTTTIRAGMTAEGELAIAVSDTGVGIEPENLERVLTRFSQGDASLSRRFDGAGLGLPLTRALIEQHGGRLSLASRVGVGTTVTLIFPRGRVIA